MGAELTHHRARLNGVDLHYVTAGDAKSLVMMVHGCPKTWYEWRKVMPGLAEHYTVVAPDLRGLGDSERVRTGYSKKNIAADLHCLVEHLGFAQALVVGHDMGGPAAYAYASLYPEEVTKLVIVDVPPLGIGPQDLFPNLWHISFHMTPDLPELFIPDNLHAYLQWMYGDGWFLGAPDLATLSRTVTSADMAEYVRAYSIPGTIHTWMSHYRAFPQDMHDNAELSKSKLPMPVLTIGGGRGLANLAYNVMCYAADDVRGAVVDDCGHWLPEEQPDELLRLLRQFFTES